MNVCPGISIHAIGSRIPMHSLVYVFNQINTRQVVKMSFDFANVWPYARIEAGNFALAYCLFV